jgi:hypothetical protein
MGDLCKHDPASWHFCNFAKAPFDSMTVLLIATNLQPFAVGAPVLMSPALATHLRNPEYHKLLWPTWVFHSVKS